MDRRREVETHCPDFGKLLIPRRKNKRQRFCKNPYCGVVYVITEYDNYSEILEVKRSAC